MSRFEEPDPGTVYAQLGPNSPIKVPIPAGDLEVDIERGSQQTGISVVDKRRYYDDVPVVFNHVPIGDYLVVKRIPEEEGLIVEADIAKDKPLRCEVVAVSPYATSEYSRAALGAISAGDKILIRRYAGTEVKVDGIEYTLIMVLDVLLLERKRYVSALPPK